MRITPGRLRATRRPWRYGSSAATLLFSSASAGESSLVSRSMTRRSGSLTLKMAYSSLSFDSRVRRV